jgi:4-amino-4-deoxy-L-arabinose transferase-like glycosyltransferase
MRQVLQSELPDRDVLYCLLEKRSVGLFHVSPFSVRLPSLLFGILYLFVVWQLGRRLSGWFLTAGVLPIFWDWFSQADGTGTAIALLLCAIWLAVERRNLNLIGICLGLSVTAQTGFAIPAAIVALAILAFWWRWSGWVDRVLIPAVVVALILLVLPLTHAYAPEERTPELTASQATHLQSALEALRIGAGSDRIRIGATPAAEPVVNFYRAQHRAGNWERARRDYSSEHFDYYLFLAAEEAAAEQRHLIVIYRDADFAVAHRSSAAM